MDAFTMSSLYIPIWFYSNIYGTYNTTNHEYLYIPIWFYSNKQYLSDIFPVGTIFTFQSGSILIVQFDGLDIMIDTLHSNLVLF